LGSKTPVSSSDQRLRLALKAISILKSRESELVTSIIPAMWEAEIESIMIQGQQGQNLRDPISTK
jgi:hypothetical protein